MAKRAESMSEAELYLVSLFDKVPRKDQDKGIVMSGELIHSSLRKCLLTPPAATTMRVNTLKYGVEDGKSYLLSYLAKERALNGPPPTLLLHPDIPDVIGIPTSGPRCDLVHQDKKIIVGIQCGNSVLRGADVYAPGVLGAPKSLTRGDYVSVYSDLDSKCLKGTAGEYHGSTMFVGNGRAVMNRDDLFGHQQLEKGLAVEMVDSLYTTPSFNGPELQDVLFLQNLPSIVVSHVLDPKPGERVLDMCAAPGGKTVHIATLMENKGCVIALDKSAPKLTKLKQNLEQYHLSCVQCFKFDATKAFSGHSDSKDVPPFSRESFDKILVDAPCSALGQRPQTHLDRRVNDLKSYPHYQRMMIKQAVTLLRVGGTLVYSTCTYSPEENECQVNWVLQEYDNIKLVQQHPSVGYPGLPGFGLEDKDLQNLQRFWPADFRKIINSEGTNPKLPKPLSDTIAFFVAKFVKVR